MTCTLENHGREKVEVALSTTEGVILKVWTGTTLGLRKVARSQKGGRQHFKGPSDQDG